MAVALIWMSVSAASSGDAAEAEQQLAAKFQAWGAETLEQIERDFRLPGRDHYRERAAQRGDHPNQPAFNWSAGVQFSALAAAARVAPSEYLGRLKDYAHAMQDYWVEANGTGGYDVLPHPRNVDRYYDDNVWIVLALLETYELTDDAKHLDRAEAAMRFVLSGEDERLGGGVYWREKEQTSKNTCSNAPAIVAACRLYQKTNDSHYLAAAERLYKWTTSRLQDPTDELYWDNVQMVGDVDRRKYTYNSAQMIRANCLLYEIKGERRFRDRAQHVADAAIARWVNRDTGAIDDSGRFAHMLLESLAAVDRIAAEPQHRELIVACVEHVHDRLRNDQGRYPARWDTPRRRRRRRTYQLIDQASAARAYFLAADMIQSGDARNRASAQ